MKELIDKFLMWFCFAGIGTIAAFTFVSVTLPMAATKARSAARKAKKANPKINYEELASGSEINEAALLDGGTLSTEDLRELERNRREIEGEKSRFDQENDALRQYQESKKTQGGKKE